MHGYRSCKDGADAGNAESRQICVTLLCNAFLEDSKALYRYCDLRYTNWTIQAVSAEFRMSLESGWRYGSLDCVEDK